MPRLLAEDLLLLCWDDEKGRLHQRCSTTVGPGIAGALVIDAVLTGALAIVDDRVQVTGTEPGDPMLTEVVAAADRRRPPVVTKLVQVVATPSRYKTVRDRLVDQGVLCVDRRRRLGIIPSTRFPPADPATTEALRERVRALLSGRTAPEDAELREVVLAGLTVPTGAIDALVERRERTPARRRAEALSNPHAAAPAAGQAVQEAQIAAMAAVAAAATAGTATSPVGSVSGQAGGGRRDAGAGGDHVDEPVEERVADVPVVPAQVEEALIEEARVEEARVEEALVEEALVEDVPSGAEQVDEPEAEAPLDPAPVEQDGAAAVALAGGRRRAQPSPESDAGRAHRTGVGLGVGAALLIGIGVVGRRLAPRARKRSTDD